MGGNSKSQLHAQGKARVFGMSVAARVSGIQIQSLISAFVSIV